MENLATWLCLRNKNLHSTLIPRVPTHAYTDWKISGRQPTKLLHSITSSIEHLRLVIHKTNDAHMLASLRRAHLKGLLTRTFLRSPLFLPHEGGIIAWLNWFFPHTPCSFPLSVLQTAFKKFCSNNRGLLTLISWGFSNTSSHISALWAHGNTSLDVNKVNGMLASNAKRIFWDNVTCFGTNKSCSNRSHLPECFIKTLHFLLARLLCFFMENPPFFYFFLEAIFATRPKDAPFLFGMASSLVFFVLRHGVETSNLGGCISTRNLFE